MKLISAALLKAQSKMGAAVKGSVNPFFKSNYADYGAVLEVVKEPLNENGISIVHKVSSTDTAHYVETILIHESGETISSGVMRLELQTHDMQKLGSAITYAKRYSLQALLAIPSEDDDGEGVMEREREVSIPKDKNQNLGAIKLQFGKHASKTLDQIYSIDPSYLTFVTTTDSKFSPIIKKFLDSKKSEDIDH